MKYSLLLCAFAFLLPSALAHPGGIFWVFLPKPLEKYPENVKALPQPVTNTSQWRKASGQEFDTNKKTIAKYQKFSDAASDVIGKKTQTHFSDAGLCADGSTCQTITNASTTVLAFKSNRKVKVVDQNDISKLLDKMTKNKEVKLKQKIHKKVLFGGRLKQGGVVAHWISPKKKMNSTIVAGHIFDAWKLIALEKVPTAIRAVSAQTDGQPVEVLSVCVYSDGVDKFMAKNFCLGIDSKEQSPEFKTKADKAKKAAEAKKAKPGNGPKKDLKRRDAEGEKILAHDTDPTILHVRSAEPSGMEFGAMNQAPTLERREAGAEAIAAINDLLNNAPRMLGSMFGVKREAEAETFDVEEREAGAEVEAVIIERREAGAALNQKRSLHAKREAEAEGNQILDSFLPNTARMLGGSYPRTRITRRKAQPQPIKAMDDTLSRAVRMPGGSNPRPARREAAAEALDMNRRGALAAARRRRSLIAKRGALADADGLAEPGPELHANLRRRSVLLSSHLQRRGPPLPPLKVNIPLGKYAVADIPPFVPPSGAKKAGAPLGKYAVADIPPFVPPSEAKKAGAPSPPQTPNNAGSPPISPKFDAMKKTVPNGASSEAPASLPASQTLHGAASPQQPPKEFEAPPLRRVKSGNFVSGNRFKYLKDHPISKFAQQTAKDSFRGFSENPAEKIGALTNGVQAVSGLVGALRGDGNAAGSNYGAPGSNYGGEESSYRRKHRSLSRRHLQTLVSLDRRNTASLKHPLSPFGKRDRSRISRQRDIYGRDMPDHALLERNFLERRKKKEAAAGAAALSSAANPAEDVNAKELKDDNGAKPKINAAKAAEDPAKKENIDMCTAMARAVPLLGPAMARGCKLARRAFGDLWSE